MQLNRQTPIGEARRLAAFVTAGLAGLMFIDLLLPWQAYESEAFVASRNGLHGAGLVTVLALTGTAAGVLVAVLATMDPDARRGFGWAIAAGGVAIFLTTFAHFLMDSELRTGWAWLGLLLSVPTAAAGVAVGASLALISPVDDGRPLAQARELATQERPATWAAPRGSPVLPPAGWYDDPERPGGKRWWDGQSWGITDAEYPAGAER